MPRGYITTGKLIHTVLPGDKSQDYREALENRRLSVMDIAKDGSGYLVFSIGKITGELIWDIDSRDVIKFEASQPSIGDILMGALKCKE